MRDLKDSTTFDLPGFTPVSEATPEPRRVAAPRNRTAMAKQEQLELLAPTDASGLPLWTRDESLDLTGLPVWLKD